MRIPAITAAILAGSALSTAHAQFNTALPAGSPRALAPNSTSGSIGLLVGGGDSCLTPDLIAGTGSFAFDNTAATTGSEGQDEELCLYFGKKLIDNDVWFEWTADFTGDCQVDTCGSDVDTKIAAYPGGGCPADDTSLACNDDSCGFQSKMTFPVSVGMSYLIQVGNYEDATPGTGLINIGPAPMIPCPVMHDGISENAAGLTFGGHMGWMIYVDCMTSIDTIRIAYGTPAAPGGITNGLPVTLGLWDDPTNDGDPIDAVLITTIGVPGGVTQEDTDTLNVYSTGGLAVSGGTWIGAVCTHPAGEHPAALDESHDGYGRNWIMGMSEASGQSFDFSNLYANDIPPMDSDVVYPGRYLISVTGTTTGGPPGVGFCFGDVGSGTPCPCSNDNDGSVPGAGCANGVFASGAHLTGSGVASISLDSLVLTTSHLEPNNSGLYFQANNDLSPGNVWGDGLQCAGGNLKRLQVRFADANGTSSTTIAIAAKAGNILPGDVKRYQCWYRTTANPPCGIGVNDFNSSNGYAVTWMP